ncbi:DUF481 domain-containing protein [Aurantibacter crassamenti]|uniref:DUF481 domain-containing protein n=1 Tax=Aurantibacter crassamenti TaxID=1837375 RepID=UPI001939B1E1|nr:DUF481 domain-containing protein [Aurantibacter crassamenti]MBM1106345.1 DUF481 domain-containing protein [Aurantibacter crassamenti]
MKFCTPRANQIILAFLFIVPNILLSQEAVKKETIQLYTDCSCEKNYLRQEITYVNHVRDQAQANVILFIYDIANGSGGRTYKLEFEGTEDYKDISNKLSYDSNANMTADDVRKGLLKKVKSGLLKYVIESDMAEHIKYSIDNKGMDNLQDIDFKDPWNNWIFEVFGRARLNKESSRESFSYAVGFESDHVTEKLRIRTDLQLNQANSEYEQDDEIYTSERFRYSGDGSIVRSISDHWSTGIFAGARHDTFTNLDFRYYFSPAIEYNIFPYNEVLRREIVFAYKIGYFHSDYIDPTIYDKLEEGIFNQSLDVQVRYRQPWGNIYARLIGSTFLNDFTKNRIQLSGSTSLRLFKGLAVSFSGNFQIIRDQINLPAGDASIEDVLLQQKQIATDYQLGSSIGLSYTFGSAYNNIINTRL